MEWSRKVEETTLSFISIIFTLLQCAKRYFIQLDDLREIYKGNDGSVEALHWSPLPDQIWHHNSKYAPRTRLACVSQEVEKSNSFQCVTTKAFRWGVPFSYRKTWFLFSFRVQFRFKEEMQSRVKQLFVLACKKVWWPNLHQALPDKIYPCNWQMEHAGNSQASLL